MSDSIKMPEKIIDCHNHLNPVEGHDDLDKDMTVERMIETQDAAGVEMTLVLGLPDQSNDRVVSAVQKYPGRFVGGPYVDPRDSDAVDQVANYHAEGMKIIKLFPNLGYYPDDDQFLGFFERIAELNMAVLSHCGWLWHTFGITAAYYSHPGRFEKLVRRFSETPFIFAHMGGIAGFLEGIMLTTRTPNAYVDCSPGQGTWALKYAAAMTKSTPPDKLLFGADSWDVAGVRDRAGKLMADIGFGEHFDKIYYSNTRGIFEKIGAVAPAKQCEAGK